MSENSTCFDAEQGVGPIRPIDKAYSRFGLVWRADLAQPDARDNPGDVGLRRFWAASSIAFAAFAWGCPPLGAAMTETLGDALVKAYLRNPDINQQRAAVRIADEEIPKASAGFRPKIEADANSPLVEYIDKQARAGAVAAPGYIAPEPFGIPDRRGFSLVARENLWNADRTMNSVRDAESRDMAARELLRNTEQNVLLEGVVVYMNVMRDAAILALERAHVHLLETQVSEVHERHRLGDATQIDVAETEADLAAGQAAVYSAQSTLISSIADYRRTIGEEPGTLAPAKALRDQLPKSLREAVAISQVEHPAIVGALHGVDAAALEVKVIESRLYPTVDLKGLVDRRYNVASAVIPTVPFHASLTSEAVAPIYDGGMTFALTRQAKETLDQRELQADLQRDRVRAAVVSVWGRNENAAGIVEAAKEEITADELAFAGISYEHKLGQRTMIEVLVAEQALLRARIQLVSAQRDQVVASYELLSAIGRLSMGSLRLATTQYDPSIHFNQVKDKWFGLRTPDGR